MVITEEWIKKYKSIKNGWTKSQINSIGVSYPLKKGWIKTVVGNNISEENRIIFESKIPSNKKAEYYKPAYVPVSWDMMPAKVNGINNYEKYQAYIKSTEWKEFRKYALEQHGSFCNRCKKEDVVLQVHHLTYERLYKESVHDVEILCVGCHKKEHKGKNRKTKKNGRIKKGKKRTSGKNH